MTFGILGPIEVWAGDERLELGGPRQVRLLAFFLLHPNRVVPADVLISGLWGSHSGGEHKRLSVAVSRLRRALEPLRRDGESPLRTVNGGYLLSLAEGELDAARFEQLVAQGLDALAASEPARAREYLRAALGLWRGPALADVRIAEFGQSESERLEELRLLALEARIDADLRLGEDAQLVAELRSLVAARPTRERLASLLMLALYRAGRQAEALDVYQLTRTHLIGELGLEPGPGLKTMQAQILDQSPALAAGADDPAHPLGRSPARDVLTMVIVQFDRPGSFAETLGSELREVWRALHDVLARAWERHGALEVSTRDRGWLALFASPDAALGAAREACAAPGAVDWPTGIQVRVRIGVHTGRPRISRSGFWGEDVQYAARLADAAHGGQILASAATAAVAHDPTLVDLGEHRIEDFAVPRRVFGLGPGPHRVPGSSDPLRTNLPAPSGELIGREAEWDRLVAALRDTGRRLTTVTGPGGSGKTLLAVEVSRAMVGELADGVFLVALAQVGEPAAVGATIATTLGIQLRSDRDQGRAVGQALSDRELLIVLDNFEHVLGAAPLLRDLLDCAPRVRLLVTSQAPLRVRNERLIRLEPLALPDLEEPTAIAQAAAVRLLLERAQGVDPRFELTRQNRLGVARLCLALDGLPLAIELAAARLALLSPDQLLVRLDEGIEALGHGPRELPERQRGLVAALDWTHGLLDPDQQQLLRRLAVFAGPVSLDRVERVCGAHGDLLESLAQLVDFALVSRTGDGRFGLHATVKQYARRRLVAAGEVDQLVRMHAEAFAEAGERWGCRTLLDVGAVESEVLAEEADIGQALTWMSVNDADAFARLAGGAAMALMFTGRLAPLCDRIERALDDEHMSDRARTWLLLGASLSAFHREDRELGCVRLDSALVTVQQTGDDWLATLIGACSVLFRVLGGVTQGLRTEFTALSSRASQLGDRALITLVDGLEPYILGYCEGRRSEASAIWVALAGNPTRSDFAVWTAPYCWPDCKLLDGDFGAALAGYRQALLSARERAQSPTVAYQLEGITMSLSGLGRHDEAFEAAGWAGAVRQTAGPALNSWYKQHLEQALERSREAIGAQRAGIAYARGRALPLDAAVNAALALAGEHDERDRRR